jgi:hypothetical protein
MVRSQLDVAPLRDAALALRHTMDRYVAIDPEVRALDDELRSIVAAAANGQVVTAMDRSEIPGGRRFLDGKLNEYADLEEAYAKFCTQISGTASLVERLMSGL